MPFTSDNGFTNILKKVKQAGHKILIAFQKRSDRTGEDSSELTSIGDMVWDNRREFLSVGQKRAWKWKGAKNRVNVKKRVKVGGKANKKTPGNNER
ncbi:unnamed protein product [Arabis nemorensis]|uniref:Uncharacterized protein n=1 Tax=Arabis nemorensis TaxID=586526 RepID=A0A565C6Z5_9BRAS|nr:unnamed protein product [Arabis nemorensis]